MEREIYFSSIYGRNIYSWNDQVMIADPIEKAHGKILMVPQLRNINSGEIFYAKKVNKIKKYKYRTEMKFHEMILDPPNRKNILWPCDGILFKEKNMLSDNTPSFFGKGETEEQSYCLLFPYQEYKVKSDGFHEVIRNSQLNWTSEKAIDIASRMLEKIINLNEGGYIYGDLHLSRFLFDYDEKFAFMDFSPFIFFSDDLQKPMRNKVYMFYKEFYSLEFAEPSLVQGKNLFIDYQAQNYSICAMLFYLFFGRYPYDGRLLAGYSESDELHHDIKFRDYHRMPVFIFDPDDTSNNLGSFDDELKVAKLWADCPQIIREMFLRTLRQANAERTGEVRELNPTPHEWLEAFAKAGWIRSFSEQKQE